MWVNGQITELGIHYRIGIDTSESQHKSCKYLSSLKIIIIKISFRRVSVEAEEKKYYVKSIMILTCVIWDWQVVQNVSAIE